MDTKQLMTFKVAAECLNFTQTARLLNFAQSSVTAQIQSLEREVGKTLFERLGKRLKLTEPGHVFKKYADQVIQLTQDVETKLSNPDTPPVLTIGATESQCTYRLPPILSRYKKRYPKAKLLIRPTNFAEEVKKQLVNGDIDLGLIMGESPMISSLIVNPLIEEKLWLLADSDNPLAQKGRISSEDLEEETLILTAKGCSYRTLLENAFEAQGIFPQNRIEFVTVEAIKQCALAGIGLAYLPAVAVHSEVERGLLAKIDWPYAPASVPTYIAWNKDKELTPNMRYFIETVKSFY